MNLIKIHPDGDMNVKAEVKTIFDSFQYPQRLQDSRVSERGKACSGDKTQQTA